MEIGRRAAGIATWRYGALGARCRRSDVEAGGMEIWRLAAGVATGGVEVWRRGDLKARCRCIDADAWTYGALEARYTRRDAEV